MEGQLATSELDRTVWVSDSCSVGYIEHCIMKYEAEGWTFHSFGVYHLGAVVLFWKRERPATKSGMDPANPEND